jgi:hypothetical protein
MRTVITTLFLAITVTLAHSQQTSKPTHQTVAQPPAETRPDLSAQDAQDLQRMKSLVQQMQTNLAFVTSIQGPLKHQFELEIEMWQLQIARMERRQESSAGDDTRK